ncbi:MAG TPA: hypothetical protein DEB09_01070 [Candidatus Magasanikbacteria bacterium]|nr:hypothetical protein [Candidatus Magasanikbacteria bacterium]
MLKNITKIITPILLIILGVATRFLPHPANFAPIGAIALFGALYLPKKYALIIPLLAMFISDIFIGFYSWQIMVAVYGSFILAGILGLTIRKNIKFASVLSITLLSSVLFFIITNFAVWAFGTMYIHNFTGLMQSYIMAIPFFKNSLLGDLFYVGVLVGGYEAILFRRSRATEESLLKTQI